MTVPVPLRKPLPGIAAREMFVIVGAGQAGCQAACTLRERGFHGRIVLVGDERQGPYMRPPLSKKFLAGELAEERLYLRPAAFFAANDIELMVDTSVESIDTGAGRVHLDNGLRLAYDKLLIATGSRPRALHLPGSTLCATSPGVPRRPSLSQIHYLKTLDDSLRLREALVPGVRVAIVGGGYIGLEVAATASQAGARVTVLEISERVLNRVTTSALSRFVEGVHRARGVEVQCHSRVFGFEGEERLEAVVCDGRRIEADIAIVGIGAVPNVELAQLAGLACSDGIIVDERCRTSDENIFAAGDCASHPNRVARRRLRLESVQNAVDQATVAAHNMCGDERIYDRVPWFWSHQYEYKLQSAGVFEGYDEIVERGSRESGSFALLYRKAGALIAVDAVNMPGEYLAARKQMTEQAAAAATDLAHRPGQRVA
jgi:3-phenylpropionate/trans-cinnamate dioxygenase ferredoxin reductase subunit